MKKNTQSSNIVEVENIISSISAEFVKLPTNKIDDGINYAIEKIARGTDTIRCSVFIVSNDLLTVTNTHEWCENPEDSRINKIKNVPANHYGYYLELLKKHKDVVIGSPEDLPKNRAKKERLWFAKNGFQPLLFVPMVSLKGLYGSLGFYGRRFETRKWSSKLVSLLRISAHLIMNLLERKWAEHEIFMREKRYRSIISAIPDIMFQIRGDGTYLDFHIKNKQYPVILPEKIIGSKLRNSPLPPPIIDKFERAIHTSLVTGEIQTIDYNLSIPEGNLYYEARIVKNGDDDVLVIIRNVTEQKLIKEKLHQAEKMQAIGQLASGIAHDFNNQLGGISGFAELIKDEAGENYRINAYANKILAGITRTSELTAQLLAFARKGKVESTAVDIHKIIDEVKWLLHHCYEKKITIKEELKANPSLVLGDFNQLHSAILSIAQNSKDAISQHGELTFNTDNVSFLPNHTDTLPYDLTPGNYLLLSITDNGIGMDEETKRHIFEPFFTTKQAGNGSGMGLAAVYGIIKTHKGAIKIVSQPQRGTTVEILLPIIYSEGKKFQLGDINNKSSVQILLVEDEAIVKEMVVTMLSRAGYTVKPFANSQEALKEYKENWNQIDLVILDMTMPDMNGRETFQIMKAINPDIKALLSSGYDIDQNKQLYFEEGIKGVIQKPYKKAELEKQINKILHETM